MTRFAKMLLLLILAVVLLVSSLIYFNKEETVEVKAIEPIVTVPKIETMSHFTDSNNTFSFDYNSLFESIEGNRVPTLDWKLNAKQKGLLLAQVIIPKEYMTSTNFSGAKLTVGASTDSTEIKNCLIPVIANEVVKPDGEVVISGYPFKKSTSREGAAGNFYETISYRGIIDGDCYVIEYTVHSINIGNYSPDQGVKEFDKSKIIDELEKIVKSFKSLINSD